MRRAITCLAVFCLTLPVAQMALANDSAYTDLDYKACETLSVEEDFSITFKCPGLPSYPVYASEGDLRFSTLFGPVDKRYLDGAFESFGHFNRTANKIEWRLGQNGKPIATILRWFIDNPDPDTGMTSETLKGQVLVVSTVAQPGAPESCVAGYIDALANVNSNSLARSIADGIAPGFDCGADEPVYHGLRGPKAGEPSRTLPEQD